MVEEGAQRASYALKLLQSEGELTIASTGKDPTAGKLVTHEYRVEGPVMIVLTTTAVEIDDELLNRCLVLTVDEDRAQTRAIHRRQRERQTLEGLLADHERERTLAVHRNAQRLLRPLLVANPYARALTFLDTRTRTRRDHQKYLTPIRSIALLHQYQRAVQTTVQQGETLAYIEVTKEDFRLANRLAHEVLGRSLDELAPQTRRLLGLIEAMVAEACTRLAMDRSDYRFSRKDVRDHTGWGHTQLKVHLHRLEELEYLLVHRGGPGQSFVSELLYRGEGQEGAAFVMGLVDPEQLHPDYDAKKSGLFANRSGCRDHHERHERQGVRRFGAGIAGKRTSADHRARTAVVVVPGDACEALAQAPAAGADRHERSARLSSADHRVPGAPAGAQLLAAHGYELPRLSRLLQRLGGRARHHAAGAVSTTARCCKFGICRAARPGCSSSSKSGGSPVGGAAG